MNPEEFKSLQVDTSGELTGIGITIGQDEKTKKLTVIAPIEDTPAFKAGLLAKDIITQIDGKSTEGMDTNQAVSLIRGKAGTLVNLTIDRNSQQKDFNITRALIEIHPVKYSEQKVPTCVVYRLMGILFFTEYWTMAVVSNTTPLLNLAIVGQLYSTASTIWTDPNSNCCA